MPPDPLPDDLRAFCPEALPTLRAAVAELSWLLGRGYAERAALTLVGDHHQLTDRQRAAVRRASCSDADLEARLARRRALAGPLAVDGFNVLIGAERALAGAPLFRGRDGALRDLAGVHGTWRRSGGTAAALDRLARALPGPAVWILDRPVSNSGRLAGLLRERAAREGLSWEVRTEDAADRALLAAGLPLATSDGVLLGRAPWVDLLGPAVAGEAWIVDLGGPAPG